MIILYLLYRKNFLVCKKWPVRKGRKRRAMDIVNVKQVKNYNVSQIKRALMSIPSGTKNTISKMTGLSVATCNTILNELEATNEIFGIEGEKASIGRPPKVFCFNEKHSFILCIFLTMESGIRKINYSVTDLKGNIEQEGFKECDKITTETVIILIKELIAQRPTIRTLSIGTPGYYYKKRIVSCGIEELNGIDLVGEVNAKINLPILVENDINAIAYGMYCVRQDTYNTNGDMVAIAYYKGRGSGAGIIIDGKIHHGMSSFAGEINYLQYDNTIPVEAVLAKGREGVIQVAATATQNICAILNPEVICFTGGNISQEILDEVYLKTVEVIPREEMPQLKYFCNDTMFYVRGLYKLALENIVL